MCAVILLKWGYPSIELISIVLRKRRTLWGECERGSNMHNAVAVSSTVPVAILSFSLALCQRHSSVVSLLLDKEL